MRFANVAVEGFEVELQLAKVLRLKLVDLQVEGHQGVESPVEEEQVQEKIAAPDLKRILAADEAEIAAEFHEKLFELFDEALL